MACRVHLVPYMLTRQHLSGKVDKCREKREKKGDDTGRNVITSISPSDLSCCAEIKKGTTTLKVTKVYLMIVDTLSPPSMTPLERPTEAECHIRNITITEEQNGQTVTVCQELGSKTQKKCQFVCAVAKGVNTCLEQLKLGKAGKCQK